MTRPIETRHSWGLWYSPDESGYYWQDNDGAGDEVSPVYCSEYQAGLALPLFLDGGRWADGEKG